MKRVWKYQIEPNSYRDNTFRMELSMPRGARVCSVGLDALGVPCVWAEVEESNPEEKKVLHSVGTGHGMVPDNCRYIGMIVLPPYVFHIYEECS